MTAPKKMSLVEFAESKAPPPCWICIIKERTEVDEAKRNGVSGRIIRDWLIDVCGYTPTVVTMSKLDKHMQGRHYEVIV